MIETDQILIIRRRRSVRFWCQECGCDVEMADLGKAEALTGLTGQALSDGTGARRWHVAKGQDGAGFFCLESPLKSMPEKDQGGG
jgi:hypothetical protein